MTNAFGLYIHIPFCVHRCSYCDFFSSTHSSDEQREKYTGAVVRELKSLSDWLSSRGELLRPLTSVFLGGGTPSLLESKYLDRIFEAVGEGFNFASGCEVTMEANPETVTEEFCDWLQNTIVNRVSLGAQSFDDKNLKRLERLASPESVRSAATLLRESGFLNFNLDLIFGIPGQTLQGMVEDIESAAALKPKHLSSYQLTLKAGHKLYDGLPSEDEGADFYELCLKELRRLGYQQYEISNFSLPGFECRHNLLYWSGDDYLGVGPSAASRLFEEGVFLHRKQVSDLHLYTESPDFKAKPFEKTTRAQTQLEAAFLELRKNDGVSLPRFEKRYGVALDRAERFPLFIKEGLIEKSGETLFLTPKGRLLADSVTAQLV